MIAAGAALACLSPSAAERRCDLLLASTSLPAGNPACFDLVAMRNAGATPIRIPGNTTRIARDGITFCRNAFQSLSGGTADLVFAYDNSGSMKARYAWISPGGKDTAFFFGTAGCASVAEQGSLSLRTQAGTRTLPVLASAAGCANIAGDPYDARGMAIRQALDYLAAHSPGSTAAAVGFNDNLAHQQQPTALDDAAKVEQIKASIVLDTAGGTKYGAPLRQAALWLTDQASPQAAKRVIVFLSDGAPADTTGAANYMNSVNPAFPIYSIFLGSPSSEYSKLRDLSTRTGGEFYRVDPGNASLMTEVMQEIVRAVTVTSAPGAVEIVNASLEPAQSSHSLSLAMNPSDSAFTGVLDSILGLRPGLNAISVKVARGDSVVATYAFQLQADGPAAPQSDPGIACFEPAALTLAQPGKAVANDYTAGPATYRIQLSRSPSELTGTTVAAFTSDTTQGQAWGDRESLFLPLESGVVGTSSNRREGLAFEGSATASVPGNGILEAGAGGTVLVTWAHPRDPRESASLTLAALKIPPPPGFITVERVLAVSNGREAGAFRGDGVVIRGGAEVKRIGRDSAVVKSRNCLFNCAEEALRASDPGAVPSFVFKTAAPFSFRVQVYDNLGNYLMQSQGAVNAAEWRALPKSGDSVAVVMSLIPVARSGQPAATGAYIVRGAITAIDPGPAAGPLPVSRLFLTNFGYVRNP